jgi:hypothetical protein
MDSQPLTISCICQVKNGFNRIAQADMPDAKKTTRSIRKNAARGCAVPTAGLEPARAIRPNRF